MNSTTQSRPRASQAGKRDKSHEPIAHGAYFTIDPRPIPALLRHFAPRGMIWEPSAGRGDLAWLLMAAGHVVAMTDLIDHGGSGVLGGVDFMTASNPACQTILTNPPNELKVEVTRRALELTEGVRGCVAMYQRHEWDTNATVDPGGADLFDHPAYAMKVVCRFRPVWFEGPGENPYHRWSWYVWDWQHRGPPIIKFS